MTFRYSYFKRFFIVPIIVAILLVPVFVQGAPSSFQQELATITSKLTNEAGVEVTDLKNNKILFSKNGTVPLNPASTMKIVTAAAALQLLGPDYRFHTKFYMTPERDLYVVGEGDPSMIIEEMRMIADQLIERGIKRINHVVVNDAFFDGYTQPGLPADKLRYNSYTGALSLNFNRIRLNVGPGKKVGDDAVVEADSGDILIDIHNEVKTVAGRKGAALHFDPPSKDDENHFVVSGKMPVRRKKQSYEKHVSLPPLYFAETLKALLLERGATVSGGIFRATEPNRPKLVLDHESKPLSQILADMNKFSNNFIAEQLVKVLGAKFAGEPGTTIKGMAVIGKYLQKLGISTRGLVLVNGSGLSYDNRISARDLVDVIRGMYVQRKLWSAFYDSLSIAGKDGTLRRRYRSAPLYKRLRAKTGTVDYVRTIAGVVPSAKGHMMAFAIILNGPANMQGSHQLREQILLAIANYR